MFVILLHSKKPAREREWPLPVHPSCPDRLYQEAQLIFSGPRIPGSDGVLLAREGAEDRLLRDSFFVRDRADYQRPDREATKSDLSFKVFLDC